MQLIHAETGGHKGSVTVDIREDDLFAAQQQLGESILSMLHAAGVDVNAEIQATTKPANAIAYDLYLRARHLCWDRSTKKDLDKAIDYFEQVIEKAPDYAPAYVGLAQCHHWLQVIGSLPGKETYSKSSKKENRSLRDYIERER